VIPDYCPECGHDRFITSRFRAQGTVTEKTNCARCGLLVAASEPEPVRRSLLDDLGLGVLRDWLRPPRPSAPAAGPGAWDGDDPAEDEGPAPAAEPTIPEPPESAAGDWLGELPMEGSTQSGEVLSPTPVEPATEAMQPLAPSASEHPWAVTATDEAAPGAASDVVGETVVTEIQAEIDGAAEAEDRTASDLALPHEGGDVPAGEGSSRSAPSPRDRPDPD
jgi:hypothetical protein